MGDYFKSWRRKTGVITLCLACAFMGGWVRSFSFWDIVQPAPIFGTTLGFQSKCGTCSLFIGKMFTGPNRHTWVSSQIDQQIAVFRFGYRWPIEFREAFFQTNSSPNLEHLCYQIIASYWCIVIPLILLSACLLLSRPRSAGKLEPALIHIPLQS